MNKSGNPIPVSGNPHKGITCTVEGQSKSAALQTEINICIEQYAYAKARFHKSVCETGLLTQDSADALSDVYEAYQAARTAYHRFCDQKLSEIENKNNNSDPKEKELVK